MAHKGPRDIRTYSALFTRDGGQIAVEFPDLPGCVTCADTEDLAMERAREALEGFLYYMEQDDDPIPAPTPFDQVKAEPGQAVSLISVRMDIVREEERNRSITKSVTVPAWLNKMAIEAKINFSNVLQEGLKDRLGV